MPALAIRRQARRPEASATRLAASRRRTRFPILALLLALLYCPSIAFARDVLRGKVVAVIDGDTITVLDRNRRQHRVRLYQIDAPEKAQDYGAAAKRSLAGMIYGREVAVQSVTMDRYHRIVGTVYLGAGDVNLEQVRRGMAWVYRRYAKDPNYLSVEQNARSARIGLWAKAKPVPPWEFRHEHQEEQESGIFRWFRRLW